MFSNLFTLYTKKIFQVFSQHGYEARIVGGAVRDSIIGIYSEDIDFATNACPQEIQRICQKSSIHYFDSGLKHGTITVVFHKKDGNNICYEITTLRQDRRCNGRHADVEFTENWKLDASRRDFTFNALYLDKDGKLYDYFNGLEDLQLGRLNYIGKPAERIQEDYLRILRCFRFQNKYCTQDLSVEILSAMKKYSHMIDNLSGERIMSEIIKMLRSFSKNKTINLLNQFNQIDISKRVFLCNSIDTRILLQVEKNFSNPWYYIGLIARYNDISILNLKSRWSISNKNFAIIQQIKNLKIEDDIATRPCKYLYTYYDVREILPICINFERQMSLFDEDVVNQVRPVFEINAQMLIEKGLKEKAIGSMLKKLERIWIEENCQISKEKLLELVDQNLIITQ